MGGSIIRRVDHIPIYVPEPEALQRLLTEVLGLPVAWPIGGNEVFTSAAVFVGNCSVEAVHYMRTTVAPKDGTSPMVQAVAFEAHDYDTAITELDRRALGHFDVPPTESLHDGDRWLWRSCILREPSSLPGPFFFLCDAGHDADIFREERGRALQASGGGLLGIDRLDEIVIGTSTLDAAVSTWQRIFDPLPGQPWNGGTCSWMLDGGPRVTVMEHDREEIRTLRFAVHDLDAARDGLAVCGLLGSRGDVGELRLDAEGCFGLDLRLVAR